MQDCLQAMQNEEELKREDLLCKKCQSKRSLDWGVTDCEEHGNEFIDWKCMFCCSVALFFCAGGQYTFCTPCHNNAMASDLETKTECEGGPDCPLGLKSHPKASRSAAESKFALGCSLCRSQKLGIIADNEEASTGVSLEKREDMVQRFGHVHGHALAHEMNVVARRPAKGAGPPRGGVEE